MTQPSTPVVLFGLERSVYTRIVRLVLEEKGIPYSLQEVEIFSPSGVPEEHLQRHPFGRIPALLAGDFALYETAAIAKFLDEAFLGPSLQPSGAAARARMNQIIGVLDSYAYRPLVWGVFVQRVSVPLSGGTSNEAEIANSMIAAGTCLRALAHLAEAGPFMVSPNLSLADLHAYPILRCFSLAPEGRALLAEHPPLQAWFNVMRTRTSVQRTESEYEARQ